MENTKKCFSCLAKNSKNQFGTNFYCDKCIQTFYLMVDFMDKEIEAFKKLTEENKNKPVKQKNITNTDKIF
jgi:hypothetical protein